MSESLRKRIATAAILIALLLIVLLAMPAGATVALLTLTILAGAWEWSAFLRMRGPVLRALYVLLVAALLPLAWWGTRDGNELRLVLGLTFFWWLMALTWVMFAPHKVGSWAAGIAGLCALVPAWLALARLRMGAQGAEWVLFVLLLVWAADIGAYFVGRRFGRRRLAPRVSPGKTWAGLVGGFAASVPVAIAGCFGFHLGTGMFVGLCLVAVGFSVVGDLTESLLKRFAGLKDSGTLFPGHGGVMDRIDSLTGAAPVLLLGLTLMGVLP